MAKNCPNRVRFALVSTQLRTARFLSAPNIRPAIRIGAAIRQAWHGKSAWLLRQPMSKLFAGQPMQPVRITAGALGNNLPHSDLTETADHGMILGKLVIDAAGRAGFDNHAEYLDLYGTERIIPEMPLPRIAPARLLLQAIMDRLHISDVLQDFGFSQSA